MIEFRNVSKNYPSGTHALNNISLRVRVLFLNLSWVRKNYPKVKSP